MIKAKEEHQNYLEVMKWLDVDQNKITDIMFATKQMSIQQGIRLYNKQGKELAMKELINLTNNDCFGETNYDSLTQEEKNKAFPILMFIILKKNWLLKTQ